MRRWIFIAGWIVGCSTTVAADTNNTVQVEAAAALADKFAGQLKPQLKQAMLEGGPTHAITVCADIAPAIAGALSAESGWTVKRVSLKARNASSAIPDSWERSVLLDFDERQAKGEPPEDLYVGEVMDGQYRYMQAQIAEPLCLVCHGAQTTAEVKETLQQYYPDDTATGYQLGEVRGAISVSSAL